CTTVGPEFVTPDVPLNEQWQTTNNEQFRPTAQDLVQWWQVFEDSTLNRLVEQAYLHNNNLKIAGLRVLEARANLAIATGNQYPQTQALVGDAAAVEASESNANTAAGDLGFRQFSLVAAVSWELDFWGRFRRGIESADAAFLASIASFDQVMVLVTAQVADIYTVMRTTEEQIRITKENIATQQRSYEIVEVLFENGESSELDVIQARTLLLSTQATIPALQTTLRQTRHALSTLLGMPPSDLSALLDDTMRIPVIPEEIAVGVPADLLRQRPDVRQAEMAAMAQNAVVGLSQSNLYPSFSIGGTLGLAASGSTNTTRTGQSGLDELFSGDSLTYSVGPSFVWPFLNYGRIKNNIRVQDARLQQALIQYRETVIQAAREVEDAMAAVTGIRQQDAILAQTVDAARRSTELALLRYKEGFADYQRVLNAQQALFAQQGRYVASKGNVVRNLISLYRALGGGWQTRSNTDFVDAETRTIMEQRTDWGDIIDIAVQENVPEKPSE
ncbi:MAG: TolC family protein, partial [Gammaproteobacteria bacterium]|nr:TolC family protein [Gammaproteobacteria bacterium]